MKISKKIISVFLAMLMILSVALIGGMSTFTAIAASEITYTSGDYQYALNNDGSAALVKCLSVISGEITLPEEIDGHTVIEIRANAFELSANTLTEIVIPDSVKTLASSCFMGLKAIEEIVIGNGVATIPGLAFAKCLALKNVILGEKITEIGNDAFMGCSSLESIRFNDGLKTLGMSAFRNCTMLKNVYFGSSLTEIYERAFEGCSSLVEVNLPDSVSIVDSSVFRNCTALNKAVLSKNLTYIGSELFKGCSNLTEVTYGDKITSIGNDAFYGCSQLKNVSIPDTVKTIGGKAFYDCASLTDVRLGSKLETIGDYAFYKCFSIFTMDFPETVTRIGEAAFAYCQHLQTVSFGNALKSISTRAFSYCTFLRSVKIPDSVTFLGKNAFSNCLVLSSAEIGNGITSIPVELFANCENLKTVKLGAKVDGIEKGAFGGAVTLEEIHMPGSVSIIGEAAFVNCGSLKKIYFDGTSDEWNRINIYSRNDSLDNAEKIYNSGEYDIYCTVNFDTSDGKISPSTIVVKYGHSIMIPAAEKADYTCKGWSRDKSAATVEYESGKPYPIKSDCTLYPKWEYTPVKYTVTFDANGGSVLMLGKTVVHGNSVALPTPQRDGYVCLGWSDSKDSANVKYKCGEEFVPTENVTLYAAWGKNNNKIEINYKDSTTLKFDGEFNPVEFSTNNSKVATVDKNGKVMGTGRGTAQISAVDSFGNIVVTEVKVNYTTWQWIIVIVLFGWIWY